MLFSTVSKGLQSGIFIRKYNSKELYGLNESNILTTFDMNMKETNKLKNGIDSFDIHLLSSVDWEWYHPELDEESLYITMNSIIQLSGYEVLADLQSSESRRKYRKASDSKNEYVCLFHHEDVIDKYNVIKVISTENDDIWDIWEPTVDDLLMTDWIFAY